MVDVDIDNTALQSELMAFTRRSGEEFLRPSAQAVKDTARRIASSQFRHVGPGVRSIHYEFFTRGGKIEYRISYDGRKRSYMGLWELGTRRFAPRPYLRPAVDVVQRS